MNNDRRIPAVPVTLLLLVCALAALATTVRVITDWDPTQIMNDGGQYLSTASNMVRGYGISTDSLAFGPHFQGVIPAPQTVWPPAYPAIIALVTLVTDSYTNAALYINLVGIYASSLVLFLILIRSGLTVRWAIVAAVVLCCTVIQWRYVTGLLSEMVFTLCILASLYALPNYKSAGAWKYLLSGVLLACTILIRHSAVLYVAGAGFGLFILLMLESWKHRVYLKSQILKLVVLIGPSIAVFAALNIRIRVVTAEAISVSGVDTPWTVFEFLAIVFSEICWFFGFYSVGGGYHPFDRVLGMLFLLLLISFFIFWWFATRRDRLASRKKNSDRTAGGNHAASSLTTDQHVLPAAIQANDTFRTSAATDFRRVFCYVVIGHLVVFMLYFSYVNLSNVPLPFTRRYVLQLYPSLLVIFFIMLYQLFRVSEQPGHQSSRHSYRRAAIWFTTLIGFLFFIAQVNAYSGQVLPKSRTHEILRMLDFPTEGGLTARKIIESCFETVADDNQLGVTVVKDKGSIWSNQGQILNIYLGVPTVALANRYYEEAIDYDVLLQQIDDYNIRMLVLIPDWAFESEWKVRQSVEWAENQNYSVLRIDSYGADTSRYTDIVFTDPSCVP